MSFNNVVPSYIMNDPEKLAKFMEEFYGATGQPRPSQGESERLEAQLQRNAEAVASLRQDPLPGMEDYAVEDDTPDAQYMDELGTGNLTSTIYRVVDGQGKEHRSNHSTALNKPYYSTLRGAKSAATYMRNRLGINARVQKGEVTWEASDDTTP